MIRVLTAFTNEVDDSEIAVSEILGRLVLSENLLANSVGIIHAHADFIDTGVLREVANALPFPTIGTTVIVSASPGTQEEMELLNVTVLTSNDVEFGTGLGDEFLSEDAKAIAAGWGPATANLKNSPALAIAFAPLALNASGDFIVKSIDDVSGAVPLFGAMAVDHNIDYHANAVLFNGEAHQNRLALLTIAGDIQPKYYCGGISRRKLFRETGTVTRSEANRLFEVNGAPVTEFLKALGLPVDGDGNVIPSSVNAYPFILDYGDGGEPVVRVIFGLTEDGAAICGGDIPVGSTLTIGFIDDNEVLATTKILLDAVEANGECDVLLANSCVGRFTVLGYEPFREVNLIRPIAEKVASGYEFSYVGGEICPVYLENGQTVNRFHNDTIVVCTF